MQQLNLITSSNKTIMYDQYCKILIGHPYMLSRIISCFVEEAKHLSLDEIKKLIKGVRIGDKIVNPHFHLMDKEAFIKDEGLMCYDIYFYIDLPQLDQSTKRVYINIEIQNKTSPGYHLVTRSIAYSSRMISSQWGREYDSENYDGMKKVYSFWIMPQATKSKDGCINQLKIAENHLSGNYEEKIENYKKIDVNKEYTQAKKYWTNYLEKHDGLNLRENSNKLVNDRVKEIYKRTILLFPLLQNEETGGVSATVEIDENREKSGRYSYCWPRDAVFITKAFDYLNMKKETDKFYENFCKKTQSKNGMWEQRFYTDGTLAPCWGYQIDETASVIYGVYEHYKNTKELKFLQSNMKMCENALHFLFKYLENVFDEKEEKDLVKKEIEEQVIKEGRQKDQIYKHVSYDLWEMNEGVHLYSLASIYGAFNAMIGMYEEIKPKYENNRLKLEKIAKDIQKIKDEIENIRKYVENNLYDENTKVLRRNTEDSKMDISTIGAVYPFELFGADEKKVLNTVEKINMTLRTYTSGYLRFEQDSYMGGKYPWPVTTLWMAMYYLKAGNKKMAQECFNFVVNSTSSLGFISEQVDNSSMKPSWVVGLGWSHAMFIITLAELLK